jgi:hypothetical protein
MGGSLNGLVDELRPFASDLVDAAGRAGLQPRVTSTVRSRSEQRRLFNRYLAGTAGFPVAPPGFSAHEYGEAFDMVVAPMEALADVGYTWQQWGGGWNPADAVHFELPGATARAKQRGREAGLPETGLYAGRTAHALAFGIDFVEGSTIASLLQLFPSLSQNELLRFLGQPTETLLRYLERNL